MSWKLKILAYDAKEGLWEDLTNIARGLSIQASVHGGIQIIHFNIADNYVDAYRWAYDHIGVKIYVFDNVLSPPVAEGVIFEPAISQDGNRIAAYGPWLAYCFSRVYQNTASWVGAGQTGAQIKHMLSSECPNISTNQDNIAEPGTSNFPWQPSDNSYPGDLIPGLASLSDAANAEWYFWLASAPMTGTTPASPIPWFQSAAEVPGIYQAWRRDMSLGGLDLMPSLRELVNDARVMWQDTTGIQNQTASAVDVDSQARYGLREKWDFDLGRARAIAADQYRDMILARGKDPQQSAGFTLNTWLYDQWGGKWPLWRALAEFPFRFTVNDLIPDSLVLGHTLDFKRTFITLAADYDYDSNILRIVPDTEDNRADAMLARHRGLQ